MVWLSWPIIKAGKKWSSYPVLKWMINPFFKRPYNEVTSVPINVSVKNPKSVPLPMKLVERLLSEIEDKFILDECICRNHNKSDDPPRDIGCIVLGAALNRMHPSHGHRVNDEEAIEHLHRAGNAGLIANIAHVWIDPLAFGTRFKDLMFICLCDDTNCLYRTFMKKRGPNLNEAFKKLPGISVTVNNKLCNGCGTCKELCFVDAIEIIDNKSVIDDNCKGCGRCVEHCPMKALELNLQKEDELFSQLKTRINSVSNIKIGIRN